MSDIADSIDDGRADAHSAGVQARSVCRVAVLIGGCGAWVACAHHVVTVALAPQMTDHPEDGAIELTYLNDTEETVCLEPTAWPNEGGRIDMGAGAIFLIVNGQSWTVEDFNTGYCFGEDCVVRVAPGQRVAARIPYPYFALPAALWGEPKSLDFSPVGYYCRPTPREHR